MPPLDTSPDYLAQIEAQVSARRALNELNAMSLRLMEIGGDPLCIQAEELCQSITHADFYTTADGSLNLALRDAVRGLRFGIVQARSCVGKS